MVAACSGLVLAPRFLPRFHPRRRPPKLFALATESLPPRGLGSTRATGEGSSRSKQPRHGIGNARGIAQTRCALRMAARKRRIVNGTGLAGLPRSYRSHQCFLYKHRRSARAQRLRSTRSGFIKGGSTAGNHHSGTSLAKTSSEAKRAMKGTVFPHASFSSSSLVLDLDPVFRRGRARGGRTRTKG